MSEKVPSPDDRLTIAEAAAVARLCESSLYEACQNKLLAHYKMSGSGRRGKILVKRSDLEAFIESRRVEAAGARKPAPPAPQRPRRQHIT